MSEVLRDGHTGSVLCVDVTNDGSKIVSGGENGELCIWNSNSSFINKVTIQDTDCTSVTTSKENEFLIYASFDDQIKIFDLRNFSEAVEDYSVNQEEINQIVVDEKEKFLAACDDSGEIKILDLKDKKVFKTLRHKHTNICASVCFRPRKPWEVVTGGLDCKLIHWDFSRPKCLNQFNMQELQNINPDGGAYMVNPPFIHNLATSVDGHYLAGALENGIVAIFDMSRKYICELFSLHAHSQGASQVHFLNESSLVSGGNDCCIVLWDLSKSNQADNTSQNGGAHSNGTSNGTSNGHSNPHEVRNENISEVCKIQEIQHTGKINWMKPFRVNGQQKLVIGDQTSNLTILDLQG